MNCLALIILFLIISIIYKLVVKIKSLFRQWNMTKDFYGPKGYWILGTTIEMLKMPIEGK